MDLVFKHLEHRCEQGQLSGAWATLLHTFEQSILDTHRSKFTQYLLWYMCRQASSSLPYMKTCHAMSSVEAHAWEPAPMRRLSDWRQGTCLSSPDICVQ